MSRIYTVPEVRPLVRELYMRHATGCCLHIVLDDNNIEDGFVQYCLDYAVERKHEDCLRLAIILLSMSKTQRLKLARSVPT